MNKPAIAIFKIFRSNPVGTALLIIASRSWRRIASSVAASSLSAPGLHLGSGCRIIGGRCVSFGRNLYVGRDLWLEAVTSYKSQEFHPEIVIGDYVCLSDAVHISSISSISIGSHCLFGSRIYVSDHNHGIYKGSSQSSPEEPPAHRPLGGGGPVVIGENVWIGDNAIILGPATIGRGAIIGANAVVSGMIPPNTIAAGAPAKVIKVFNSESGCWDRA